MSVVWLIKFEALKYLLEYLKFLSTNKVSYLKLLEDAKKLKKNFIKYKIIWIGVHTSKKIDKLRPNTFKSVEIYNKELKNFFNRNFIDNKFKKTHFTKDGYHLNFTGHEILLQKISKLIK